MRLRFLRLFFLALSLLVISGNLYAKEIDLAKGGGKWLDDLPVGLKSDIGDVNRDLGKLFANATDARRAELVDSWKAVIKHADLRVKPEVLSKLDDIVKRGKGLDHVKLKQALDGDLGDVLASTSGDNLTKMLNRLDADHVTGSHLDEITSRLGNADYGIKQDLINNPGWFETFDDVLKDPGSYWERVSQGELINGSALNSWAQGKWWKDLRETAQVFQNTAGINKVREVFEGVFGSQITMKVTKGNESFEIVADYLAKKDGVFHIIDTKYTTLDNFDVAKSFTPNQSKAFPWMKNGDDITIEIRADDSKLVNLNLLQGDMLDPTKLKIDIYKSVPGNSSQVGSVINYK